MAFGAVAAIFLLIAVLFAHLALWTVLSSDFRPEIAALIVGGGDLALALLLGVGAAISSPGRIEREALAVRETARVQVMESLSVAAIATSALRSLGEQKLLRVLAAAIAERFIGRRRE